jgi:hypothetical protein
VIYWDKQVSGAKVKARLGKLPPAAQVSFAAGALTHALDLVSAAAAWRELGPLQAALRDALGEVWKQVATELRPKSLREQGKALFRFLPDEDDPSPPGVADLVEGVAELCKLMDAPKPLGAQDVAGFGYQAVASVAVPPSKISGGEAAHLAAEQASPECHGEIAFQLGYLVRLETEGAPFTYDRIKPR